MFGTEHEGVNGEIVQLCGTGGCSRFDLWLSLPCCQKGCLHCIALVFKGNVVFGLEDINSESDRSITIMGSIYDRIEIAIRFMGGWHGANHRKLAVRHLVR